MNVIAAEALIALGCQGETTFVIGIDDVGQRCGFRHDRQPSEGVGFLVDARQISGDGLAAGAVKTVAPCDVVAVYAVLFAIFCKGDIGGIPLTKL